MMGGDGFGDYMGGSAHGAGQGGLDMRGECGGQSFVLLASQGDGLGEHVADGAGINLGAVNAIAELCQLGLFGSEQQCAKLSPFLF
jgi:hypothetical protein